MFNPMKAWREWRHERFVDRFIAHIPPPPHLAVVREAEEITRLSARRRSLLDVVRGWSR